MSVPDVCVEVTWNPRQGYFVATIPDRAFPIVALSLDNLRKQVEAVAPGAELVFDRAAAQERNRRRVGRAPKLCATPAYAGRVVR